MKEMKVSLCDNSLQKMFLQNEQKFRFLHPYAIIELFLLIQCWKFSQSENEFQISKIKHCKLNLIHKLLFIK